MIALTMLAALHQDLAAKVDQHLAERAKEMRIPGMAYAVVRDGKIIHQGAYGLASIGFNAKATPETPFLLASITKQFTATAIMKLFEEGKIDVDAKIGTYLEDAPEAWSGITVRHLLGHTGGLTDRWEEENPMQWKIMYTKSTMYEAAKKKSPLAKPGEKWSYTDQGYFLLGMIIEKVSGKTYSQYLSETFFKPLGMDASRTDDISAIVPGQAQGYIFVGGKWMHNHRRMQFGMTSHYGVISTVGDLAKWATALQDGKVVKPSTLAQMWKPVSLGTGDQAWMAHWGYGFGWFVRSFNGHPIVQHGGATGTNLTLLPDQKMAVIVLTNLEQAYGGDATSLAEDVYRMYVPEMSWAGLKPKPDSTSFNSKIKEELIRLSEGKMDLALYADTYGKTIESVLSRQQAGLSKLVPVKSVDLLYEDRVGKDLVSGYRVEFRDVTLFANVRRNSAGKIEHLALESE